PNMMLRMARMRTWSLMAADSPDVFYADWGGFVPPLAMLEIRPVMEAPATNAGIRIRDVFRRGGLLSKWHPRFEYRPGQLAMAEEVEAALAERRHLLVEAGTGTGKTLAYLFPVLASGKRVIVSTGTKALQEQ